MSDGLRDEARASIKFLMEAAKYFETRGTAGEDMAHWSNVYNCENCRKAARVIDALLRERSH